MPLSTSFTQASLAATILISTIGTYIALSPPNPSPHPSLSTGDALRWLKLTHKHAPKVTLAPLGLIALHTSRLAYLYPNVPPSILRHGAENGLNTNLIRWSAATTIPLSLILCAGVPLRLIAYASLGKNFTFALTEPDHLKTTGIYHYVQHPSYLGLVLLVICNVALLGRMEGTLSCWIPPRWYRFLRRLEWVTVPVGLSVLMLGVWTRVQQEEGMLWAEFGAEWEMWHAATARFIPGIF